MAFDVNWGIGEAVDVGGMVRQGFERGRVERDQRLQRNALATYAQDPNPQNLNALAPYQPEFVLRERERQNEIQQAQQRRDLTGRAAMGDSDAMGQLAGIDVDTWMKLDDRTRQRVKQGTEFMGQAVLQVSQLPEQQRAQAWASLVQQAEAGGMDIPPQYERYSPQALNAAAAEAGTMQKMLEQFEPKYQAVPQGGGLINTRDPNAVGQWNTQVQQGAAAAPPPPPGFILDDGGPTQPASGGFRP